MHFEPIVLSILLLAVVAALGLALGNLRIKGIGLGIAGVLFAGIGMAQFHFQIDEVALAFVREFGLILFVYMTGMQVGRGFLTALKKQGLPLNLLAAAIVALGALLTIIASKIGAIDMAAAVGIFCGATTNTPSLGAAHEALLSVLRGESSRLQLPGLGYAVSYPFGVLGIILSLLAVRAIFKINPLAESAAYDEEQRKAAPNLSRANLLVTNPNLVGVRISELPALSTLGIVVSRIKRASNSQILVATKDLKIENGDILLVVGEEKGINEFKLIAGVATQEDLTSIQGSVSFKRIAATHKNILGKSVSELLLKHLDGVTITRVARADIQMSARPELKIEFGDILHVVGEEHHLANAAKVLGNSLNELGHTNLIPLFLGIALGILIGVAPIHVPGLPSPVKLGLAGGPLLIALLMSRLGRIGPLVCYVPPSVNAALREFGIVLFLAAVGLKAGGHFFDTLLNGDGIKWILWGAAITTIPLLLVAIFARKVMKMNYLPLTGLMSGSMTDPPALAFANSVTKSDSPSVAYATVYPITMLLRILAAQLLAIGFA